MASIEVEILEPAATVETVKNIAAKRALNRRNFMAAMGMGGTAAGAALLSGGTSSRPSVVQAAGVAQTDVLNFALNLEFLEATFYSYITQGTDLPPALTVGSGVFPANTGVAVTNPPAKLVFTGPNAQQITDLLNEVYYDELNHVIALRGLLGSAAITRPALNLNPTAVVITSATAIGLARLLEDVGVTAYTGSAAFLSGSNVTAAAQILAVEGFHAGAIRLFEIQNPATTAYVGEGTSTYEAQATTGSPILTNVYFTYPTTTPSAVPNIGQLTAGQGIPAGVSIIGITGNPITGTATVGANAITGVTNILGLLPGQVVVGAGIPSGTTITAISSTAPYTLSLSAAAVTPTNSAPLSVLGNTTVLGTTNKAVLIQAVSSLAGLAPGQVITGSGVPVNTTIVSTATANITVTGAAVTTTAGTTAITGVTTSTGLLVGQILNGPTVAAGTTITAISGTAPALTLTISAPAIASSSAAALTATNNTITISQATTTAATQTPLAIGVGTITLSGNATATFANALSVYFAGLEPFDVQPADIGPGVATTGPASGAGFFDTSGTSNSNALTPTGLAFARTTSQVLAILYGGGSILAVPGTASGGFFPNGVNGSIKTV